jgi:histidinol dehydrogenase
VRVERIELSGAHDAAAAAATARGFAPAPDSVREDVAAIVALVADRGDAALTDYTRRFDTGGAAPPPLRVAPEAMAAALKALPADLRAGLEVAAENVATVARAALTEDVDVTLPQGHRVFVRERPVRRAAIYVPGGRAPYPSSVVMGVVTARVAGVERILVCSPPSAEGPPASAILAAAALCGADEVYAMGGAQAIAALAYGTESVPRVDVIAGPGNLYVQEAKRLVAGDVGIDGFAGPSDVLVVAGPEATADLVAMDLLAQGEHGAETVVGVVSWSTELIQAVESALRERADAHPGSQPAAFVFVVAPDAQAALAFADAFAPEHLELVGRSAEMLSDSVRNAGCVFIGEASGTAFGDYVAGSNHVLPTGGAARFASGLSVATFRRRMAQVEIGDASGALAAAGVPIATAEGFVAHADSMRVRTERAVSENGHRDEPIG